jgi:CheY-like chemotaxis protein
VNRDGVGVLLVEDNLADVALLREAVRELGLPYVLTVVSNGRDALEELRKQHASLSLMILDLNLPIMSGGELLSTMQAEPGLLNVPVVVLSTAPCGLSFCHDQGAIRCRFFTKPLGFTELLGVVQRIEAFRVLSVVC